MNTTKPIILIFIKHYLPGYKFGGPMRSISNLVDHLGEEFDFRLITSDRDFGDRDPYANIKINQWQPLGNAMVYYLTTQSCTLKEMAKLATETPHDVLYLNSFFDPMFSISMLVARYMGWLPIKPMIIAPRGEFEDGSIKIKYPKKYAYIQLARLFRLYKEVAWQASSEYEALDIVRRMKIKPDAIHIAFNLPAKINKRISIDEPVQTVPNTVKLRIAFLSRISREKNLDYALGVLSKVSAKVRFDIYGPTEDASYWKECQKLIRQLPANVTVNYLGSVSPNQVVNIISRYDLFFLPTTGENYGHVIVESLSAGTPVLISDKTPWRNLQDDGLGWDKDLGQMELFVEIIEEYSRVSVDDRLKKREITKLNIMGRLLAPDILEANRQLFDKQLPQRGSSE